MASVTLKLCISRTLRTREFILGKLIEVGVVYNNRGGKGLSAIFTEIRSDCSSQTLAAISFFLGVLIDLSFYNPHPKNGLWTHCSYGAANIGYFCIFAHYTGFARGRSHIISHPAL